MRPGGPLRSLGQRKGHCPGHGELESTNRRRRGERLCEGVGGLISSGDVDEAESASVDHLVTEAVVAGVDVGAFA